MRERKLISLLGFFVFCIFSAEYFWGIGWGVPNERQTALVFPNSSDLEKYKPKILEKRNFFYRELFNALEGKSSVGEYVPKLYHHYLKTPAYQELSEGVILDAVRSYLIGLRNSDEQKVLSALSHMNPRKFQFGLRDPIYGGFYHYGCGLMLGMGSVLGLCTVSSDVGFYLTRPQETHRLYVILRSISAICAIAALSLLYVFLSRSFGIFAGLVAVCWLGFNPWMASIGHLVKPHALSVLLLSILLTLVFRDWQAQWKKWAIVNGLIVGVAAGSLVSNCLFYFLPILFLCFGIRRGEIKQRDFLYLVALYTASFIFVFAASNFYLISSWKAFAIRAQETKLTFNYGIWSLRDAWPFLSDYFKYSLLWVACPLVFYGLLVMLFSDNFRYRICGIFLIFYLLVAIFYARHQNVLTNVGPLIILALAFGVHKLVAWSRNVLWKSAVVLAGSLWIVFMAFNVYCYLPTVHSEGPLLDAGSWINANISEGTSIGIAGGWPSTATYPPFNFLRYRLIHLPWPVSQAVDNAHTLPEYAVTIGDIPDAPWAKWYQEVRRWEIMPKFCGKACRWETTENIVLLLRKVNSDLFPENR